MDKEMTKYLEYLEKVYVECDSFVIVIKVEDKYRIILPTEIDTIIEDKEECEKFTTWLQKRMLNKYVKYGVLDFETFREHCESKMVFEQVQVTDEVKNTKEFKELIHDLMYLNINKKTEMIGCVKVVSEATEKEFLDGIELANKRIKVINEKYGCNLPPVEYGMKKVKRGQK